MGYANEYIVTFENLNAVTVTDGNWNELLCRIEF